MMSQPNPPRFADLLMGQPYVLLVLCNVFWGGNVVASKAAAGNIDPYAFLVLRWIGTLLLVLPFAAAPFRRDSTVIRAHWLLYFFYGAVGYATFNILVYVAAYFTSGVNSAIDQVAINILVMLINFALFRTRVKGLQLVGVAISIIGVALTATHGDLSRLLRLDINFGDALVLGACLAYAIYSVALRWRPSTSWLSFLAASFVGAFIASIVFAATAGGGLGRLISTLPAITPLGWALVAYVMVFPSILSQLFYARGLELIGANRASLFINLIPLFGALGSVIVLGETLQGFHLIAGGLVIAGIVIAEWSARQR